MGSEDLEVQCWRQDGAVEMRNVDGTVSWVDRGALGGGIEEMPEGYFGSWQFVGPVVVSSPGTMWIGEHGDAYEVLLGCLLCKYLCVFGVGVAC